MTIMIAVTTRTAVSEASRDATSALLSVNVDASGAPKMCACRALSSSDWLMTPTVLPEAMLEHVVQGEEER